MCVLPNEQECPEKCPNHLQREVLLGLCLPLTNYLTSFFPTWPLLGPSLTCVASFSQDGFQHRGLWVGWLLNIREREICGLFICYPSGTHAFCSYYYFYLGPSVHRGQIPAAWPGAHLSPVSAGDAHRSETVQAFLTILRIQILILRIWILSRRTIIRLSVLVKVRLMLVKKTSGDEKMEIRTFIIHKFNFDGRKVLRK